MGRGTLGEDPSLNMFVPCPVGVATVSVTISGEVMSNGVVGRSLWEMGVPLVGVSLVGVLLGGVLPGSCISNGTGVVQLRYTATVKLTIRATQIMSLSYPKPSTRRLPQGLRHSAGLRSKA